MESLIQYEVHLQKCSEIYFLLGQAQVYSAKVTFTKKEKKKGAWALHMMRQTVNQNRMGNSRDGSEVLSPWGS